MTADIRVKQVHALFKREQYADAYGLVSELLNERPDNPECLYLAGCILRSQGHIGMALALLRRALSDPAGRAQPNLWMHYGACLHDTHQHEQAREAFHKVRLALPSDPQPPANIAATYVQEGKAREAIEWADKAMDIDPNNRIAHIAKAFGALGLGRWSEGWKYADALYGETIRIRCYTECEEPEWDGSAGKTVVVQADQGLGDIIMFAQCLTPMLRDCKKVVIETSERLVGFFRRNWPEADVYGTIKDEGGLDWPLQYEIDARIHISLLGRFYRKRDVDFPRQAYVVADEGKRAKWRGWLAQFPRPWVGVAWVGGIPRTNTVARSVRLADLEPVLSQPATFVSLAYQDVAQEIARWNLSRPNQVHVPRINNDGDYDETLALLAELDHVVTVTTTVAHACGALGKPASVLVNRVPAWRYVHRCGDGMIWYPESSVRLYRQAGGEVDWQPAISRIASDFSACVAPHAKAA